MKCGIDRLLAEPSLRKPLAGKRVALLAHPASVTSDLTHSLDALAAASDVTLTAAFGPLPRPLLDAYPHQADDLDARHARIAFETDLRFGWNMWAWAGLQAASGDGQWLAICDGNVATDGRRAAAKARMRADGARASASVYLVTVVVVMRGS